MKATRSTAAKPAVAARERTRADHWQRVLRVLVHVRRSLDADLSLARLARLANLSPEHFQRIFTAFAGESCKRHVRRLRLERAARELRERERAVADIAVHAGYTDVPSFYRAFRDHFRMAPARWRDRALLRQPEAAMPPTICRWQVVTGPDGQMRSVPHLASGEPPDAGPALRVVQLAPLRVAFVRRVGSVTSQTAAAEFARLLAFAARRGVVAAPLLVRIHHDDPSITPVAQRQIDHGITIGPRRRGEADIGMQSIGGDMLVATCGGGSANVPAVRLWLENRGLAMAGVVRRPGPVLEILLDDPDAAPNEPPHERRDDGIGALHDVLVPIQPPAATHPWYWRRRRSP